MDFELREPVLVVGLGGAGSRLAAGAGERLGYDRLLVSNDPGDLAGGRGADAIRIDTGSIVNPSAQAIRGFALESAGRIRDRISGYSSVIMMSNLAGRAGSAMAPVVSSICRAGGKGLISFAIMPFGYESDRMFSSGVALKRVKADSACTVIVDNDAMLQSNPDLTAGECHKVSNSAAIHIAGSLRSARIPSGASVLSADRGNPDPESSLRDSFKMLCGSSLPGGVNESIIHVVGGDRLPVGMMKTIAELARGSTGVPAAIGMSHAGPGKAPGIVMLSAIHGRTKFDGYDPLGIIPDEDTLDWESPDCSYDCKLDSIYQME